MQIASTLPPHNLPNFPANCGSLQRAASHLNPLKRPEKIPAQTTKNHLANLEKLLEKQTNNNHPEPVTESNASRGILDALKLADFWSQTKAAEEMSPRHMDQLQRLLSKSPEYSPRNYIGGRWREYHGSKDWSGLLDPLDENLRREVVRSGEFIQAAYHYFHSNPATPCDTEAPAPRQICLPDRSYRVTKSLYATASVGLPKWVDDVAPDLGWMTQRSSWIGYVAVCDDRREIQRMGRRDIIIALRGTSTCLEWVENVRDFLVPLDDIGSAARVECGFSSLFATRGDHVPSLRKSVTEEIQRLLEKYKGESLSITITGHSLGAALALLIGDELSRCSPTVPPVAVFSFGGPRVGNRSFADRLKSNDVKVLRIVNSQDVITRIPGMFVSEYLDDKMRGTVIGKTFLDVMDDKMPWSYAHAGTVLKVDNRVSPFLKPNADIACCHDLEAYLHLVDGFLSSNCPFRSTAKRSLWRLVHEQRSNVKRLYTKTSKSLTLDKQKMELEGGFSLSNCLPSPSQ